MKYYYLDGIEKKGPYSIEEIKSRNLSKETMIYREDKFDWLPLSNFIELNSIGQKELPTSLKLEINQHNKVNKIKIPKYAIYILSILLSIGIAFLITHFQQNRDYEKISKELNEVFKGQVSISDYQTEDNISEEGNLYNVKHQIDKIWNIESVEANGITLFSKPYKSENENEQYYYNRELKKWNLYKNLNQYFIKSKYKDGFTVLNLMRDKDYFTIVTFYGGDMAYKVPAKTHYAGTNYGYFSTPGYDIPTYRPSINSCYESAAKYLTVKNEGSKYIPDSYSKILDMELGYYKSDFFEVIQVGDKYLRWTGADTIHIIRANGERSYVIEKNKITPSTSTDDGYVYDSSSIVWYKNYFNRYSLKPKKLVFLFYWSVYSIIIIILFIAFYFFIKNRKRFVLE